MDEKEREDIEEQRFKKKSGENSHYNSGGRGEGLVNKHRREEIGFGLEKKLGSRG